MGFSKSIPKKEFQSNKCLLQKTRKILNKQPRLTPNGTRKRINTAQRE